MNILKNIFGGYKRQQSGRKLSPHAERMLAVDEKYAMTLVNRDAAAEHRRNKRQVKASRVVNGEVVRYTAGVLSIRDHGGVVEKLRKQLGGKRMRRIIKAERRELRENPDALVVVAKYHGERIPLRRGQDFVLLRDRGNTSLVLDSKIKDFEASYSPEFAISLVQ